jgi:hypothetical protein
VRSYWPVLLVILGLSAASGQNAASTHSSLTPTQAQALVLRALATESHAALDASHPMQFAQYKKTLHLTTTKEIVETKDGNVARLLSYGDQPLSAADEQRELARLDALMNDPSIQKHRKKGEEDDTARAMKVLHLLPTAFIYQYVGIGSASSGMVEKYSFKPNPQFVAPDMETGVLTAMAGEIWIDVAQERVVRLEGHLQQDKSFGWGLIGELYKGGWLVIDQADVGRHQWRIVHMKLVMSGRVLFKTKNSDSEQYYSHFSPVPVGLSYRQAIEMLRESRSATTQGHR